MRGKDVIAIIVALGVVSLLADVVYEGGRSVSGPLLSTLEAPAIAAGLIAAGEVLSYGFRPIGGVVSQKLGPRGPWYVAAAGYAASVVSIPMLALASTWPEIVALYLLDRAGKGVRAPARDSIIASLSPGIGGPGKAFALHEVLDQAGALAGPLAVAFIASGWDLRWALALLAAPGAACLAALGYAYRLYSRLGLELPRREHRDAGGGLSLYTGLTFIAASMLAPWPLLSFHMSLGLEPHVISILYAVAMAADALAAVASGYMIDRIGLPSLAPYPLLALAAATLLTLEPGLAPAVASAVLWGAALGFLESGFKAGVALVEGGSPKGYGLFGFSMGLGLSVGGFVMSGLYEVNASLVIGYLALMLLASTIVYLAASKLKPARRS